MVEWWSSFLTNWGELSGWSLFISLCLLIVIGLLTDRIWSGKRGRRAEEAAEKASKALQITLAQNTKLIESQGFAEYVFKELLSPRKSPIRGTKLPPEGGDIDDA